MFSTRDVWMVVKAAKLSVVEDDRNVEHRMAECQLVIDPLPSELAEQLGENVAGHLFNRDGMARHELATITLDPRVPKQRVSVRQVTDGPHTEIRDVEVLSLTGARQEDEKTGKEWIKATVRVRFDLAPKVHREWLSMHFGYGLYFSFDVEQMDMLPKGGGVVGAFMDEISKAPGDMDPTIAKSVAKLAKLGGVSISSGGQAVQLGTNCQVCGGPKATKTVKELNGLPKGLWACEDCRDAVKRREVGVSRDDDGTLHITDSRRNQDQASA